jgi:cytochrome P450
VRRILIDDGSSYSSWEGNLDVGQALFGRSILFMDGDEHRSLRSAFQPAFARAAVESYVPTISAVIDKEMSGWTPDCEVDCLSVAQSIALENTMRCLLGASVHERDHKQVSSLVRTLANGTYSSGRSRLPWSRFARADRARRSLYEFSTSIDLAKDRTIFARALRTVADTSGCSLGHRIVLDNINAFLFASLETTSAVLAWAFWYLCASPRWYDQLEVEISAIEYPVRTLSVLNRLPVLDAVVREVLRLRPPVYFLARMATQDTELAGFPIPSGTLVNVTPLLTHLLPTNFENPDVFDPARFYHPSTRPGQNSFTYLPYGVGRKSCIGALFAQTEIKLTLIAMLRAWTPTLVGRAEPLAFGMPVLYPSPSPRIRLRRRDTGG